MSALKLRLHWQILIALVLAIAIGLLIERDTGLFGVTLYAIFAFFWASCFSTP